MHSTAEKLLRTHSSVIPGRIPSTKLRTNQTKKKQDKLLAKVACDHGDDGVPAGQNLACMWNYLRKYKNNHAKNSLPTETRSNASTDARIWESGLATLNPLNWHCYRFALGHHLFNHKLSPYDEKEAKLIFSRHASVQAQASTATPHTHPLIMLPFTLLELTTQIKKLFPDKSSGPWEKKRKRKTHPSPVQRTGSFQPPSYGGGADISRGKVCIAARKIFVRAGD